MSDYTICAHCGLPLHPADYGLYNAHPESRCIDLLRAELAEARLNDERYRWLIEAFDPSTVGLPQPYDYESVKDPTWKKQIDAAIDAARKETP